MRILLALLGCFLGAFLPTSRSIAADTGFLDRTVVVDGTEFRYQVFVPPIYSESTEWPVILFLHGSGERGNDGTRQTQVGLPSSIRWERERWPAIVVFPQVPTDQSWQGLPGQAAMAALDQTLGEFHTDRSRVVLTGMSMGGMGTWYLGSLHPDRFAALVPVCGFLQSPRYPEFVAAEDPYAELAGRIAHLPVWIFHGDADTVVPVEQSRKMAAALERAGATVRYTELPGVGHNAWDGAYGNEELPRWILEQRR